MPAGTPRDIVLRLNADLARTLQRPGVAERLAGDGAELATGTLEQFGTFIRAETARWTFVIRDAGIIAE